MRKLLTFAAIVLYCACSVFAAEELAERGPMIGSYTSPTGLIYDYDLTDLDHLGPVTGPTFKIRSSYGAHLQVMVEDPDRSEIDTQYRYELVRPARANNTLTYQRRRTARETFELTLDFGDLGHLLLEYDDDTNMVFLEDTIQDLSALKASSIVLALREVRRDHLDQQELNLKDAELHSGVFMLMVDIPTIELEAVLMELKSQFPAR